jgi:hypothetical protein
VGFGAFLVDTKMAHHFPDMTDFDVVELWEVSKYFTVEFYSSAMRRSANIGAFRTMLQHSHNFSERH